MKTINLNGEWRLSGKQQESEDEPLVLKAEVPGCVQLDLSREGYLPEDLYLGENIKETEKFEDWEWQYERTFTAPLERENVYIVFNNTGDCPLCCVWFHAVVCDGKSCSVLCVN
jgi:hypothetical protein